MFKELNALKPHKDFRLWLTSEVHPKFPTILLQSSIKITYEAPPGIKKNLLRTFENWTQDEFGKGGTARSQTLFVLAWFHAIVQERRKYIPQVFFFEIYNEIFFIVLFRDGRNFMNFLKQIYAQDSKLYIDYVNELEDNVSIDNIFISY